MAILKYKNAEGNFVPLNNYLVQPITPVQTTGNSPTDIMSLAAVTDAINSVDTKVTKIEGDITSINLELDTKVTKIEGKGLSTNDYTTSEKDKLAAIEAGANKYILPAATTSTLGGIIVGDRLSIDSTGKLVATYTYTLPTASGTVLGGVKTGSNITNTSGTISLTKANVTTALGVDPTTTYVKKAGDSMTGDLTSTAKVQANILKSTVATGTAPVQVTSTTVCTNLNADMIDGYNITEGDDTGIHYTKYYNVGSANPEWLKLATLPLTSLNTSSAKYVIFEIAGGGDFGSNQYNYSTLIASTRNKEYVKLVKLQSDTLNGDGVIAGYVVTSTNVEIWLGFAKKYRTPLSITCKNKQLASDVLTSNPTTTQPDNFVLGNIITLDAPDWYGVSWSETSSNPDCTRIGNLDMHRTLPIQSMMKPFVITNSNHQILDSIIPISNDFSKTLYSITDNNVWNITSSSSDNIMIKIPEFWYIDDYVYSSKTHNLKLCAHSKPGWNHHKEAYVSAYELYKDTTGVGISTKDKIPTTNFNRTDGRAWARANGSEGTYKWNLYTYEEHRAICHLFLVEYATRNSQKAVNTSLTVEGFRQGGLGSGCTTGTATINGVTTYSFIPTGSSNSLGSGSGEVTVTIQLTDASGNNTTTVTRKCNRYRGIENPFGHVWKHCDDIISVYSGVRTWYKSIKPDQFSTNKNASYKPLCSSTCVAQNYKTEIKATPTCDFFAAAASGGSENTYWCDYNWDNTDTAEHCLLIGGGSGNGGAAGLFYLRSSDGVGGSNADVGSRLTYLPWAE